MPVPRLSLLGLKRIRGFLSILRYINPTIIIIILFIICIGVIHEFICRSEINSYKLFLCSSKIKFWMLEHFEEGKLLF